MSKEDRTALLGWLVALGLAVLIFLGVFKAFSYTTEFKNDWLFLVRNTETSQPTLISITTERACKEVAAENNIKNGWNKKPERYYCYHSPGILNEGKYIADQRPWPEEKKQ